MKTRHSALSFVLVRLDVAGRSHLLFLKHSKWGDWGLVGGHVEPGEEGNWLATASREADEELDPLRYGRDFSLIAMLETPVTWGPIRSRSAKGSPTIYTAQYFALRFQGDPRKLLAQLEPEAFLLVPQEHFESGQWEPDVADTLRRLADAVPGSLASIPLAWDKSLGIEEVAVNVRPFRARRAEESGPSTEVGDAQYDLTALLAAADG